MQLHPLLKIFLICLSGFLLSLSAPGYDVWLFAWVGLVPLFIIINTSKQLRTMLLHAFLFGFAYNFWYLHWLFSIHPLDWLGFKGLPSIFISAFALISVASYNSLFFVLFGLVVFYFKKMHVSPYNKGILSLVLISFFWTVIFNKISSMECLFGFPWTLIEYSQYKNLFLIQFVEFFGSISVSFILVFFNLLLSELFLYLVGFEKISDRYISKDPGKMVSVIYGFVIFIVLISLSYFSGVYLYHKNKQALGSASKVICIVQGNLPISSTRGNKQDINFAKRTYAGLIKNSDGALVVFPEGALPTVINHDPHTQYWLKTISHKSNADIISGAYCKDIKSVYNCAVNYLNNGKVFLYYEKERLVPFGEFVPFSLMMPRFIKRLADNLIGDGFIKGKKVYPLQLRMGKAGVNICFELIFPAIIRTRVLNGAQFIVNISDLGWFSNDLVKRQFLSFAVFRAIENRKPVVIAANSGISAFIEPNGRIGSQSISNTQGLLLDWINPNNKITYYCKYGW